jgi:hypothetical protein
VISNPSNETSIKQEIEQTHLDLLTVFDANFHFDARVRFGILGQLLNADIAFADQIGKTLDDS